MKFETSIERRLAARHKKCLSIENFKGKIIDIGCSYGWFEKNVKNNPEIVAIDICEKDLEIAKSVKNKNIQFEVGSALDLSKYKKNDFDYAVMFDVIEHIPKNTEEKAICEAFRVLKNKGKFVISTPASNFSNFFDPAWYFGHRHYTKRKLIGLLEKNGFSIKKVEIHGGFYELFSMILFYPCKWFFNSEIPFKKMFDKKRDKEYLSNKGYVTLFIVAEKNGK